MKVFFLSRFYSVYLQKQDSSHSQKKNKTFKDKLLSLELLFLIIFIDRILS